MIVADAAASVPIATALAFAAACGGRADAVRDRGALAARVADAFVFVGHDQAPLSWAALAAKMAALREAGGFACEVERVETAGDLVFLQLRERHGTGEAAATLTTMTVFEFEPGGLLRRIDAFR